MKKKKWVRGRRENDCETEGKREGERERKYDRRRGMKMSLIEAIKKHS